MGRIIGFLATALLLFPGPRVTAFSAGASSGFFLSENPGSVYVLPPTAALSLSYPVGEALLGVHATFLPFIPRSQEFETSTMLIFEGEVGYPFPIGRIGGVPGALYFGVTGGGYLRTATFSGATLARRPTAGATVSFLLDPTIRWRYGVALRYRVLFDRKPVHTVEPAVLLLYRIEAP